MNTKTDTINNAKADQQEQQVSKVDFKMVTFTLAGKDYGIDIMKVKEIHKAEKFTFVPNSAPFVKGVYNMRGDIISVIDLRVFFNLPVTDNAKGVENMIILRLEDHTIGVLVDTIDKVIGIDSSRKQPPHPLFGDINIKYIDGVVENDSSLYIILDVEKIFSSGMTAPAEKTEEKQTAKQAAPATPETFYNAPAAEPDIDTGKDLNIRFIEETLPTYRGFHPSEMNSSWIHRRYDSWVKQKGAENTQLNSKADAEEFLRGFNSPYTGQLWGDELLTALLPMLPDRPGNIFIWNPGCGRGFETYSVATMLKKKNPSCILKIQANDSDLIGISSAPGLLIDKSRIPSFYEPFLVNTPRGAQFNEVIKDSIIFEYSDLNNERSLPPLDCVVCRDTLSYLPETAQRKTLDVIYESMKPEGILILGTNEQPFNENNWEVIENNGLKLYKKK